LRQGQPEAHLVATLGAKGLSENERHAVDHPQDICVLELEPGGLDFEELR